MKKRVVLCLSLLTLITSAAWCHDSESTPSKGIQEDIVAASQEAYNTVNHHVSSVMENYNGVLLAGGIVTGICGAAVIIRAALAKFPQLMIGAVLCSAGGLLAYKAYKARQTPEPQQDTAQA